MLETAEHERNEFKDKLQQAESDWNKEYAAFKRTEGYKYVGDLDRYREREILAAASLENTRQKVAEEVSLVRGQMLSLEQELKISGDEKSQLRHELQAEIAQERQQQEEKSTAYTAILGQGGHPVVTNVIKIWNVENVAISGQRPWFLDAEKSRFPAWTPNKENKKKEMDLLSLKRTLQAVVICGYCFSCFWLLRQRTGILWKVILHPSRKNKKKREAMLQEWQYKSPLADITRCG